MKPYGYAGGILQVDVGSGEIERAPLPGDFAEKYIGGWGINAALAYDLIKPGMDAYDPGMPLIFGAGLLAGTLSPGASKSFLTTKDGASGTVVTAVGSLGFGTMLKWAGYDHLIITGKADTPVYLEIVDDHVELHSAADLWGRDIMETTAELKKRHGGASSVACIGPAGENMVKISIMFTDYCSTFGRSFGANLGFRKLKAIVVKGTRGTRLADAKRFMKTANQLADRAMKDPLREKWTDQGLYATFPMWASAGYFTYKNGARVFSEKEAFEIYGPQHFDRVKQKVIGCPSCVAPDKFLMHFDEGEFEGLKMMVSCPIDPAMSFGIRNELGSFDGACWMFHQANRLGLDAMTLSTLIDFAADLFERGAITKEDTDGMDLKPGFEITAKLLEMTVKKVGFGRVLADGFEGLIRKLGHEEEAYQIKGTEPDFDARASLGVEVFGAVVNPRGAHDMPVGGLTVARGRKPEFFRKVISKTGYVPEEAMQRVFKEEGFDLGRLTAHYENWGTILNCLGVCFRMQNSSLYDVRVAADLFSAATGIEKDHEALLQDAERAYNLYKMLNVREGFERKDDCFPKRWFEPLKRQDRNEEMVLTDYFGKKRIGPEETEKMLDAYYEEKGWDIERGIPSPEKLCELGLEATEKDLKYRKNI